MKIGFHLPQVLILIAALLAPIFGGYVASDATAVEPGALLTAMGEGQAPILQHALLALPVFVALIVLLLSRRVQQIPHPTVAGTLGLLVASLAPSVAISPYRAVSLNVWIEWAAYAVAFLAAVAGLGRRLGPVATLGAVAFGTAWIARIGVFEYLANRRIDPNWRVFCNWNNPNAAAAMLVLGLLCAFGLPRARERSLDLLLTLGVVVGGGLILGALYLTGSKGGTLLALPTGLVVFGLLGGKRHPALYPVAALVLLLSAVAFLKGLPLFGIGAALLFAVATLSAHRVPVGRMVGAFAFAVLMIGFFRSTTPGGRPATTGGSRIAAAAATQDQSAIFRLNLWRSALALAEERPVTGWGLGSFRYESARPGLVTPTVFAHDSYLQLLAEAGVAPVLLLLGFLGLWSRRALRGSSRLPDGQRLLFAAAVGGVASVLAHCLVDSDLSYFGLGLTFFLVLGAATLLATDAVAPEFIPPIPRGFAAAGIAGLGLLLVSFGFSDLAKSEARYAQSQGSRDVAAIEGLAGWDGDAAYLWALAQPDPVPGLQRAFALQPTPKIARALANALERQGDLARAESSLYPALAHDPNNLKTLYLLMNIRREADAPERALETARRLVAVENKPVFRIRALDQLIPTETYLARIVLAKAEKDPVRKAELLAECVRGLRLYADITAPEVARMTKIDPRASFAGESSADVREKLTGGANAARAAADLYSKMGNAKAAQTMRSQAAALEKAIPEP